MQAKALRIPKVLVVLTLSATATGCGDSQQEEQHCFCALNTDSLDGGSGSQTADAGFDDAGCAPPEELQCFV